MIRLNLSFFFIHLSRTYLIIIQLYCKNIYISVYITVYLSVSKNNSHESVSLTVVSFTLKCIHLSVLLLHGYYIACKYFFINIHLRFKLHCNCIFYIFKLTYFTSSQDSYTGSTNGMKLGRSYLCSQWQTDIVFKNSHYFSSWRF